MNRLTERNKDGGITVRNSAAALEKLTEPEDVEQNGRLVRLPCSVGDTVYQVDATSVYESTVKGLIFDTTAGFAFDERAIGKTVFLSKKEAEAALKERVT